MVERVGDVAGEVVGLMAVCRQGVTDALRALRRRHPRAAGEIGIGRRRAKVGRRVEPQSRDGQAGRHRQAAVPVIHAAVVGALIKRRAEYGVEFRRGERHPDGPRVLRRDVTVVAVQAEKGAVSGQGVLGVGVIGRRRAIGRPQGAAVVEMLERGLARAPVARQMRRRIVGARQDEGDVDRRLGRDRRARQAVGVGDGGRGRRAVAGEIEKR